MSSRRGSPADRTIIAGAGISRVDQFISPFARAADVALDDAKAIAAGNTQGLPGRKVQAFMNAAGKAFGSFDVFRGQYATYEAQMG